MTRPRTLIATLTDILENGDFSQAEIARATGISPAYLSDMKKGRRRITAEHDLRLSRYLGQKEGFFLRLQLDDDLHAAKAEHGPRIISEVRRRSIPE